MQSVLSQQLNGHTAEVIISKTYRLFLSERPTLEKLRAIPSARLRAAGVSQQKAAYLKDLTTTVADNGLDLARLSGKSDEEIVRAMDEVKGVGRWTAQILLIFSLGRSDVLPVDDFGVKTAIRNVCGLR